MQGGHGKGRREADEKLDPVRVLGEGDPNFNELEKDGAVLTTEEFTAGSPPRNDYVTQRHFQPCKHSLPEFKKAAIMIVDEYFSAEDTEEVGRSLAELESPFFHYEFVKRVITMSMDRKEKPDFDKKSKFPKSFNKYCSRSGDLN